MDDGKVVIKNLKLEYISTKKYKYDNEYAYFKIKETNVLVLPEPAAALICKLSFLWRTEFSWSSVRECVNFETMNCKSKS